MKSRGFTLIEVLVVMALLSLLLLGMTSALFSAGQTEARVDARLTRMEQQRSVQRLLTQLLGSVSAQSWRHKTLAAGVTTQGLLAQDNSIEWVGVMPPRHGVGGRHFLRLGVEQVSPDAPADLVLSYLAWDAAAKEPDLFPDWSRANKRVLVSGVTAFRVQARSQHPPNAWPPAKAWPGDWQSGWSHPEALPEVVGVQIAVHQQAWPPLWIAVRPASGTSAENAGFTVGGGSR